MFAKLRGTSLLHICFSSNSKAQSINLPYSEVTEGMSLSHMSSWVTRFTADDWVSTDSTESTDSTSHKKLKIHNNITTKPQEGSQL